MLPKESKSTKCEEHRTVSILTHTSKILTKIILGRIEKMIDENLRGNQLAFKRIEAHAKLFFICEAL